MNKKIVKIVVIVLVIIFALIGLEALIRGLADVTEDVKKQSEIKKEEKEYKESYEYELETYLDTSIDKTLEYLANGDFDTIYSLLDAEYKDYMNFESLEVFKEYITAKIGKPEDANIVSYNKNGDKYVCTVAITTENSLETHTILVKPFSDGTFTIILDDLTSIEKIENRFEYTDSKVTYNIRYKVKYHNELGYAIDVTNNGSTAMKGSFEDTVLNKSGGKKYYVANKDEVKNVEIGPGETKRVIIKMDNLNGGYFEEISLDVIFKAENGEKNSGTIVLERYYWE